MTGNAWLVRLVVGAVGVSAGALATGCETPQSVQDEIACTTVCRCFSTGGPLDEDACITECVGDLGPVSDECFTCINTFANECTALAEECSGACGPSQARELEEGGSR